MFKSFLTFVFPFGEKLAESLWDSQREPACPKAIISIKIYAISPLKCPPKAPTPGSKYGEGKSFVGKE